MDAARPGLARERAYERTSSRARSDATPRPALSEEDGICIPGGQAGVHFDDSRLKMHVCLAMTDGSSKAPLARAHLCASAPQGPH